MKRKFEIGDRVRVCHNSQYKDQFVGEAGEIIKTYKTGHVTYFGVKLDNHFNFSSAVGVFWFTSYSLEFEDIKNIENTESEEIIMFDNFKVAEISFINDTESERTFYYALYDDTIHQGDTVVVHTAHHGFAVALVVEVFIQTPDNKNKVVKGREIVCLADMSEYNRRQKMQKKALMLKHVMKQRVKEAQEIALYEALADKDPVLKDMLEEYKLILGCDKGENQ